VPLRGTAGCSFLNGSDNPVKDTDPTGHDPWGCAPDSPGEQACITREQTNYNDSQKIIKSRKGGDLSTLQPTSHDAVTDVSGTWQDPAFYISFLASGGITGLIQPHSLDLEFARVLPSFLLLAHRSASELLQSGVLSGSVPCLFWVST